MVQTGVAWLYTPLGTGIYAEHSSNCRYCTEIHMASFRKAVEPRCRGGDKKTMSKEPAHN